MTKKSHQKIFAGKMEIFSEKYVILAGENFVRPLKLGARFPPLV